MLDLPHQKQQGDTGRSQNSIFDRVDFRDSLKEHALLPSEKEVQNMPELIKIREEAVRQQEQKERQSLQKELDRNKISPRTFEKKQRAIETWVSVQSDKLSKLREEYGIGEVGTSRRSGGALGVQKSRDLIMRVNQDTE